jgi:hypothetical protein
VASFRSSQRSTERGKGYSTIFGRTRCQSSKQCMSS